MNKEVLNLFNQPKSGQTFDHIRIGIASPEKILSWSFGEIKNLKQLIIEHLNLKEMDYFVQEFLVPLRIMNVCVENTSV